MRALTDVEKDKLKETLVSSAMGYERAVTMTEEWGGSDGDLLQFCIDEGVELCNSCDWYCDISEMHEKLDGDQICNECLEDSPEYESE